MYNRKGRFMPDQYNNPYDPTEPLQPPPSQGGQGKLILGNPQNQPGSSQRRPYQYPQSPQPPQTPPGQPPRYPQGPQQGGGYSQKQGGSQMPLPAARPNDSRYPNYPQPGQIGGPGAPKRKRRGRGRKITALVLVTLVVALV